jgi:hypothetical protein
MTMRRYPALLRWQRSCFRLPRKPGDSSLFIVSGISGAHYLPRFGRLGWRDWARAAMSRGRMSRSSIVGFKAVMSRYLRSWPSWSRLVQRFSSPRRAIPRSRCHTAAPAIPLVFVGVSDPVGLGLVESLAHPGGNATGLAALVPEGFTGKQLQLLKEFVPQASRIAVLMDPRMSMHQLEFRKLRVTGRRLGVEFVVVEANKPDQFETAFETAHTRSAEAIHVWNGPHAVPHSAELVELRRTLSFAGNVSEAPIRAEGGTGVLWSGCTR